MGIAQAWLGLRRMPIGRDLGQQTNYQLSVFSDGKREQVAHPPRGIPKGSATLLCPGILCRIAEVPGEIGGIPVAVMILRINWPYGRRFITDTEGMDESD